LNPESVLELGKLEMKLKLVVVAVLSLSANIAAQAATLNPIQGVIFTRAGSEGFHKVTAPTEVNPGDTVMAALDSNAQIVLSDGTVIPVGPGQVITIPQSGFAGTQTEGINPTYALLGVGAAVGIGVGIYYATKTKNPASP
jgi:hypothetical protein